MDDRERHQQGMKIRREVLGNDHVDRATQSATELHCAISGFAHALCWGEVWSRLAYRASTRSLLTLAMTVRFES